MLQNFSFVKPEDDPQVNANLIANESQRHKIKFWAEHCSNNPDPTLIHKRLADAFMMGRKQGRLDTLSNAVPWLESEI